MFDKIAQQHLAIAPHFTVHREAADRFLLFSEDRSLRLRGEIHAHLLPLLSGEHTGAEIAAMMPGDGIRATLERLYADGQIVGVARHGTMSRQAFWSAEGRSPVDTELALAGFRVAVWPLGRSEAANAGGAAALIGALAGAGLGAAAPQDAALTVVLVDDYLDPGLPAVAERLAGRRWLPMKPGGRRPLVGPLIGEDEGCAACLIRRMAEHRPNDGLVGDVRRTLRPAQAFLPASLDLARATAVLAITRLALDGASGLEGRLLALDAATGDRAHHRHWRFNDCPSCRPAQPAEVTEAESIDLSGRSAVEGTSGGWRTMSGEEALARLEPLVSDLTGIITRIEPMEAAAEGLYVFNAVQATPTRIDHMENRRAGKAGAASGKGMTAVQSRISCLAEAMERYSSTYAGTEPRRLGRLADFDEAAFHPGVLMGFSDRQYDNREALNAKTSHLHFIPKRFDEMAEIDWTPVWSVTRGETRWVPTRFAYFDYHARGVPGDHQFCLGDSNGCAAGATLAEASLQGMLELVERDAVAIWWYNRLKRPGISLEGIDDAFVARMEAGYARRGRGLHLLDVTTDVGIPAAIAVSARTGRGDGVLMGFGAHFDPRIAAVRALTELNQIVLMQPEDGQMPEAEAQDPRSVGVHLARWLRDETLETQPYLAPDPAVTRHVATMERPDVHGIEPAMRYACNRLEALGMETMVLDYARTDTPLACVKVIVPGMRHFWARRGPGRLNEVPARMGWLDAPSSEDDLNPIDFVL